MNPTIDDMIEGESVRSNGNVPWKVSRHRFNGRLKTDEFLTFQIDRKMIDISHKIFSQGHWTFAGAKGVVVFKEPQNPLDVTLTLHCGDVEKQLYNFRGKESDELCECFPTNPDKDGKVCEFEFAANDQALLFNPDRCEIKFAVSAENSSGVRLQAEFFKFNLIIYSYQPLDV